MAIMKSSVKHIYDAHSSVVLRAPGSAAVTATGYSAVLSLNALSGAYWDGGEIPYDELEVALVIEAMDAADGDETYKFEIEVGTDASMTGATVVASVSIPRATPLSGYTLCVDADTIRKIGAFTHMRLKATLAGTSPSVKYAAWLTGSC